MSALADTGAIDGEASAAAGAGEGAVRSAGNTADRAGSVGNTAPQPNRERQPQRVQAARVPIARRGRTYGALDLGTNNCRLLIARPGPNGFIIVDAYSRVVRLGEGLMEAGRLSDAAMDRTLAALAACADKLSRRDVRLTRNVAPEACRRASNGMRFVERVFAETGIALDVISAAEEARLAVLGCHMLIEADGPPALVFDIGGGSTEVMLVAPGSANGGEPEIIDWISMPWGVVSLAETEPQWATLSDRELAYDRMRGRVAAMLDGFAARLAARGVGKVQLLGTSGTITTLASVEMGLTAYDRRQVDGSIVDAESLLALCRSIALQSTQERARVACIGSDRAELIVAGCAIVDAILSRWPGGGVRVADRGIREGILRTLMGRDGVWAAGR
jgi:exopolyphosphatase/guanosine-5'-triphosphate,3'-diphosphate pyrophosphatase